MSATTSQEFTPLFAADAEPKPETEANPERLNTPDGKDFFLAGIEDVKKVAYDTGYQLGHDEALRTLSEKLEEQIATWNKVLDVFRESVSAQLDAFFTLAEERTVQIGLDVARRVASRELAADRDGLVERIATAYQACRGESNVVVRVSQKEFTFLVRLANGECPDDGRRQFGDIEFVEDPAISPGGFVVETPATSFDYSITTQLEAFERSLGELYENTDG